MWGDGRPQIGSTYAAGQLQRALEQSLAHPDPETRQRAEAKAGRWRAVIAGMEGGRLTIGSRAPVRDTPSWVTLEVVHGGFATGRRLAERPLDDREEALLADAGREPPADGGADQPGATDRERLNLWYLTDAGIGHLSELLAAGAYRVDVPEDGALPVVAWLLSHDRHEEALDLVAELWPWMHRLRFAPTRQPSARPAGATVRLRPAAAVARDLRAWERPAELDAMEATLATWNPLYDRLVALWCETVGGELPTLERNDDLVRVRGGWPCRRWPDGWSQRRAAWLDDHRSALVAAPAAGRHHHLRSNYARLHRALERVGAGGAALTGRDVGWIRRCLANTISSSGAPGSAQRRGLRAQQAAVAQRPSHGDLAAALADRLDRYPGDAGIPLDDVRQPIPAGGLPAVESSAVESRAVESWADEAGWQIPGHLLAKAERAVEAPIQDLVQHGVIRSSEVLATVLPQVSAQVMAEGIDDGALAELYRQIYAAFRRRRSLLLVDLEHQVQLDELPWIAALQGSVRRDRSTAAAARDTLAQMSLLAMSGFPQTILPNPLVREFGALATKAQLDVPFVEEVAADIFVGTFTMKWQRAAVIAGAALDDSLYARYYDLPAPAFWGTEPKLRSRLIHCRPATAERFAQLCRRRATEAGAGAASSVAAASFVAVNGAVLEQAQILTTHNLATLAFELGLAERMSAMAEDLASRSLAWVVERLSLPVRSYRTGLQSTKNAAYAWRQAIFFLSLCEQPAVRRQVEALDHAMVDAPAPIGLRFRPAVDGLRHVVGGGRFAAGGHAAGGTGRRFLGWSVGPHWALPDVSSHAVERTS